jgi:hypothetical protein
MGECSVNPLLEFSTVRDLNRSPLTDRRAYSVAYLCLSLSWAPTELANQGAMHRTQLATDHVGHSME